MPDGFNIFDLFFISEKLRTYFQAYGPVQDAVVMKDPVSRRSRGFGFITFEDIESVDNVLANEPHTIDSRKVIMIALPDFYYFYLFFAF